MTETHTMTVHHFSTDEKTVQVARDRRNRPYLAVTNDEGEEVAAVFVAVDERTGVIAVAFDQYRDCTAQFEVVEHAGATPNNIVWRTEN